MKINMWLIAEKLAKYKPTCDIKDGSSTIEGIRYMEEPDAQSYENRYVYLCTENSSREKTGSDIMLINGEDLILLHSQDTEGILNSLLDAFEFYNRWESSLWELSAEGNLQQLLDKGGEALNNPMIISALDGSVLAMSSRYKAENINENWVYCRDNGYIPSAILGMPVRSADHRKTVWKQTPQILLLPENIKTIGALICSGTSPVAAISLWEYKTRVNPGHVLLMDHLCTVIRSIYKERDDTDQHRTSVSILTDLLNGVEIDNELLQKLELQCRKPWILLTVNSPDTENPVTRQSMIRQMITSGISCIPMEYEHSTICLIQAEDADRFLDRVFGRKEREVYSVVRSVPFDQLAYLRIRYRQNLFCIRENRFLSGIYHAEDTCFRFAMEQLLENTSHPDALVHPLLPALRMYDEENDGDFYRSLYYYLFYERSIKKGAEAVHVHRNSFHYRIRRIQTLFSTDLDDPSEREYLLFSYELERRLEHLSYF